MTKFVFKSLMIAGAFLFFGGHAPLPGEARLTLPQFACEADLGSCRLGQTDIALGERSPLFAALAARALGNPIADLQQSLSDPKLASLLDERVVPEFAVAAAQTRLAALANQFIEGIETGAR